MQFDLDKCAKVTFTKGSLVKTKNITQDINTEITELKLNKMCKYFRINKVKGINRNIDR